MPVVLTAPPLLLKEPVIVLQRLKLGLGVGVGVAFIVPEEQAPVDWRKDQLRSSLLSFLFFPYPKV